MTTLRHLLILLTAIAAGPAAAQTAATDSTDEARLVTLAMQTLEALGSRDTTFFKEYMLPKGHQASVAAMETPEGTQQRMRYRFRMNEDFVERLPERKQDVVERMWDPTVLIDGAIGVVWAPYDFYVEGEFSHCGRDVFTFFRSEDDWKIVHISWTIERSNCPESPLGPLGQ
jgi:hypothetical protein